jgi:hypothetical protein
MQVEILERAVSGIDGVAVVGGVFNLATGGVELI